MHINILLPDGYKKTLQELADRETFGNVTMLVRLALCDKYPALKSLPETTRKKRGNGKGKQHE